MPLELFPTAIVIGHCLCVAAAMYFFQAVNVITFPSDLLEFEYLVLFRTNLSLYGGLLILTLLVRTLFRAWMELKEIEFKYALSFKSLALTLLALLTSLFCSSISLCLLLSVRRSFAFDPLFCVSIALFALGFMAANYYLVKYLSAGFVASFKWR